MIHDSLLSCLNLYIKRLPIEEFVISDAVSTFLHPGEKKILEDIIKIINLHRNIAKFAKIYSVNHSLSTNSSIVESDDEPLQAGLYLNAFANGIDIVLEDYLEEIAILEQRYLQNPSQSLLFIYQKLSVFEPLFLYLKQLIRGIRSQKLHGCAIIQYLHQNMQHGDDRILNAMKQIISTVNVVFLKQLTHWILYAKIVDTYGEFFIQCAEFRNNTTLSSGVAVSCGSGRNTITSLSDAASTYAEIWKFEICYELLPHYLSTSWAEKVLFIGQTVLIFKVNADKISKNVQIWTKTERNSLAAGTLWNENEHLYFEMIQALHRDTVINVSQYERVVDEIKLYVTTRLSEIAINQADLVKQLKLIKDFYLLGRGELYLEFIRNTYKISKDGMNENKVRDLVKAFESAAHAVGVSEDLDQFSLNIPKPSTETDDNGLGYIQNVQLSYKINWPLHLLFSPKVIERYNTLFRFLLLLKKMQYQLHMVWCSHIREKKQSAEQNINVTSLRNQLMFFIDNLQYYIQVDVLESQFSILINMILNKADFEQIQRSHSVFQANILSLCFLLGDEDPKKTDVSQSCSLLCSNPVYAILNDIFHVCEEFCEVIDVENDVESKNQVVSMLNERFGKLIEQLTSLLVRLKSAPSFTPLSQLLLHLDFNHWFSSRRDKISDEDEI